MKKWTIMKYRRLWWSSVVIVLVIICILINDTFDLRNLIFYQLPDPQVIYANCTKIPVAPKGTLWPEEQYIHDPELTSVLDLADPLKSQMWVDGSSDAKVGDTVHVKIVLYDGHGNRRKTGGDLVRVWLKEISLGASATANVIDNKDGSYSAICIAFWAGQPEVMAAIISPRQVIATAFKRRYVCPPILMNIAVFRHPKHVSIMERTPCNYDNQVPGYSVLCNLTHENYNRPWFCGKPRNPNLLCQDWAMAADKNLWKTGMEKQLLSKKVYDLMARKYSSRRMSTNLSLTVAKGDSTQGVRNRTVYIPSAVCGPGSKMSTWERTSPTGFFFARRWTNKHCRNRFSEAMLHSCLQNTRIVLIGDSTIRQLFSHIESLLPCTWITDTWTHSGVHRPATCINTALNFSLAYEMHALPFCTGDTPHHYLKSFRAYLDEIQDKGKVIVVLHIYAHIINYHSHAFYETLKDMKRGVLGLLYRNINAHIIIKGPHASSFSTSSDHTLWMTDAYAEIYQEFIYHEFKDINDRVVYLESMDMTVSTEQSELHAEQYIIQAQFANILNYSC